jgi:ubiquinone/menaquinone biosynthesis C-methylase UbiE
MYNKVSVPIFEFNKDGSIKPNPLFHRSWDKLHSRCIEYPYAASQLGESKKILDVGTTKSDIVWINWLDNLPIEVYATDYDNMNTEVQNLKFVQSDVRKLPFEDNYFDKILAVSVIEHIGLEDSQVLEGTPEVSSEGDIDAIKELKRILKPGGEIIMTLPYSKESFIYHKTARIYSKNEIEKINRLLKPKSIDYYEYQHSKSKNLYEEFKKPQKSQKTGYFKNLSSKAGKHLKPTYIEVKNLPEHYGAVTWRKVPLEDTEAKHYNHIDGVICGVWSKQ